MVIAKKYKWKATANAKSNFWHYFSSKERARKFAGNKGNVRKR